MRLFQEAADDGRTSFVAGFCEPGPPTPGLLEARISGLTEATYKWISGLGGAGSTSRLG